MVKLRSGFKFFSGSLQRGHVLYLVLVVVGLFLIGYSALGLIDDQREYASARSEYDQLRELRPEVNDQLDILRQGIVNSAFAYLDSQPHFEQDFDARSRALVSGHYSYSDFLEVERPDPLADLAEINRDFIGWIMIGDFIYYPVVRGRDNLRYLDTKVSAKNNLSGTIFMDSANTRGFDEPVAVLYGHNMRNGSMFAPLHRYRDRSFLEENPNIIILTSKGELLLYRIFAARVMNVEDRDADLGLSDGATSSGVFRSAPAGSNRFLVLSTCTSVVDDERLRVYAALVE